jgi:hypothetical protein
VVFFELSFRRFLIFLKGPTCFCFSLQG